VEREYMDYDIVIVGAGPSGLAAACRVKQINPELSVVVVEKGSEVGLASVERRAFSIARSSLGNREDALDVVQEAMTQLVARYSNKNPDEWRPLFYRILQSKINDLHRRHKVQNKVKGWLNRFRDKDDGAEVEEDPFQNVPGPGHCSPHSQHETGRQIEILQSALAALPARQQQAFVLRCWEGFSTTETATTMKCSEGSVKTHYSRAIHSLRATLGEHWHE
jgi:RNA polymerase sigma-70 factor (ECF subfamily)